MKKFLSLVLALVMTMSLVTVAGAKDFNDAADIQYEEAVAVLSEIGVVDGYLDGNFNPDIELNRGQAAKIICNLVLGPTTAAALHANVAPFADVPADHQFAGYIAYCVEQGFASGYADGTFKPGNKLTGYAFQKMLLCALGYDQEIEGYVGENWSIQVAKQALAIGLTNNLKEAFNGVDYVTREEACLYALNALQATTVEYDSKIIANVGGAQVTVGTSVATDVAWNIAKNTDGNIKDDDYVQFAEKHFPKLELEIGEGMYGRPANTWKNKKAEIGTFTSIAPDYIYTEGTESGDVYKDLGKAIIEEYDWTAYINGREYSLANSDYPVKGSDATWGYTGEGRVCEIYVNDDAETVTVVEYNWYFGQVQKVKSDDDGEYITVKVISTDAKTVLDDKTFYVEGYAEDDYVNFTMDYVDGDYVIGEVAEPEVVTAEVTRVELDKDDSVSGIGADYGLTYLKTSEGKYIYAIPGHIVYDLADATVKAHPALAEEYNLYLDPNGYVDAFEVAEETVTQYLYVKDSDEEMEDWKAKVELPDATAATIAVDVDLVDTPNYKVMVPYAYEIAGPARDSGFATADVEWIDTAGDVAITKDYSNIENLIWKFSVGSDDVYELSYININPNDVPGDETQWAMDNAEIKNGKAYVTDGENTFIVDKKTVFVDTVNDTVYTGYEEVPNVSKGELVYVIEDEIAEIVFILDGEIYDEASVYFILAGTDRESLKYDKKAYWDYSKAYVDGTKTNLIVKYDADPAAADTVLETAPQIYKVKKTIDEDYITEVEQVAEDKHPVKTVGVDAFWINRTLAVGETELVNKYDTNEETIYVVVELTNENKYKIYEGDLNDMKADDDYKSIEVQIVKEDEQTAELVYIFKTEKDAAPVVGQNDGIITLTVTEPAVGAAGQKLALSATEAWGWNETTKAYDVSTAGYAGYDTVLTVVVYVDGNEFVNSVNLGDNVAMADILAAVADVTPNVGVAPTGTHVVEAYVIAEFENHTGTQEYTFIGQSNVLFW